MGKKTKNNKKVKNEGEKEKKQKINDALFVGISFRQLIVNSHKIIGRFGKRELLVLVLLALLAWFISQFSYGANYKCLWVGFKIHIRYICYTRYICRLYMYMKEQRNLVTLLSSLSSKFCSWAKQIVLYSNNVGYGGINNFCVCYSM